MFKQHGMRWPGWAAVDDPDDTGAEPPEGGAPAPVEDPPAPSDDQKPDDQAPPAEAPGDDEGGEPAPDAPLPPEIVERLQRQDAEIRGKTEALRAERQRRQALESKGAAPKADPAPTPTAPAADRITKVGDRYYLGATEVESEFGALLHATQQRTDNLERLHAEREERERRSEAERLEAEQKAAFDGMIASVEQSVVTLCRETFHDAATEDLADAETFMIEKASRLVAEGLNENEPLRAALNGEAELTKPLQAEFLRLVGEARTKALARTKATMGAALTKGRQTIANQEAGQRQAVSKDGGMPPAPARKPNPTEGEVIQSLTASASRVLRKHGFTPQ